MHIDSGTTVMALVFIIPLLAAIWLYFRRNRKDKKDEPTGTRFTSRTDIFVIFLGIVCVVLLVALIRWALKMFF